MILNVLWCAVLNKSFLVQEFDIVTVTLHKCCFLKPSDFIWLVLQQINDQVWLIVSAFTLGHHLELQGRGKRGGRTHSICLLS